MRSGGCVPTWPTNRSARRGTAYHLKMRRTFFLLVIAALLGASAALAAGEPQKKLTPADQARAKAMLMRQADVGIGYRPLAGNSSGSALGFNCPALDESDLTVSGEASSPNFSSGLQTFSSASAVYVSVSDAKASWRRGTSTAGFKCLTAVFKQIARARGLHFVSFRKLPFPALAPQTAAYRWQSQLNGVRVYADVVILMRGRAQSAVFLISGIDPLERSEALGLTRLISTRMAKAMRGG
jgi:hypothetical protein